MRKTKYNNIIRNTVMLYGLNIAKMVFPLLLLPYLTRVLSVSAYGTVSYVRAVMSYMQLIVDFGFMLSGTKDIVNAANNKTEIDKQVGNILLARILLGVVAFTIICIAIPLIPLLKENALYTILSYSVVFSTCFLVDFYFRGIEHMEIITIRFVAMKGVSTILTLFIVKSDADIIWIPVLELLGSLIALILVWGELKKNGISAKPVSLTAALNKIKESFIYFFSDIATTAFNALNTLLIGIYIQPSDVAFWSICIQLIGAVQSLYSPITNGIYPHMVRTKEWKIIKKALIIFMPLIALGCIFTFFVAKYVLLIIAGEKYIEATTALRLLIPVLFFGFPAMLLGWPALGAIEKQQQTTITTIISACIQISLLSILIIGHRFTLINICIARSFTEFFLFFVRLCLCKKYKNDFK